MKCRQIMAMGICVLLLSSQGSLTTVALAEEGTEAVVTEAPVTEPPVTEAPATEPPATEPPATEAPVTEAPAIEPPATEAPATEPPVTEAPVTEAPATEAPATEAPGTETEPGETIPETEAPGTELITEEEQTETSEETENGLRITELSSEEETESEIDDLIEEDTEESEAAMTNEELIARQNIVTPPPISLEFRFMQTDKVYAVVKNPEGALVKEERSEDSATVGRMEYYGLCYILADEGSDWVYVESGNVRGFIRGEEIVTGDTAERLVRVKGEVNLPTASLTLARSENSAYTYTHTTVYPVIAPRVYALAKEKLEIHEARQDSARTIGTLEKDGLCYILADGESDWVYVESGNSRGFVRAEKLITGTEAQTAVAQTGENNMTLAETVVEPEDNSACYYTLTSVKEASQSALIRSDMVNYSFQFLGNPYVWGGTSLTNGCDCSGFTMRIYGHYGYSLPRVAEAQAVCSMQIPVSSAEPGDLIFYAKNGYVYHVSMYIGDGKVIHAANSRQGITISGIGSDAVWAVRIIQD